MMEFYKKIITDNFGIKFLANQEVYILKVPSKDSLAAFLFLDMQKDPMMFIKSPRDPLKSQCLVIEAKNLKQVRQYLDDWELKDTVPRLVDLVIKGKNMYLLTSVVKGTLIAHKLTATINKVFCENNRLILSIIEWLVKYHRKTFQKIIIVEKYIKDYLVPIREEKQDWFTPALENVWQSAIDRLYRMANLSIPITLCHGDFNSYNIFTDEEKISGVIDWADLRENVPLIDFFNFITVLICSLPYRDYSVIVNRFKTFYKQNGFSQTKDIYLGWLKNFNISLDIPEELNEILYQIHLVLMAIKWERGTIPHNRWEEIALFYSDEVNNN